jgi:hypothetical protein
MSHSSVTCEATHRLPPAVLTSVDPFYKCLRMKVAIFQASIAFQGIEAIV